MDNFEIHPSDLNDGCMIIKVNFKFENSETQIKNKTIVYH